MRTKVWFDGHELTEWCIVGNLTRPLLPRNISSVEVPGRDGGLLAGVTLSDREVSMTLTFRGKPDERAEKMRMVAAILNVSDAKELTISEDNGLSYRAIPNAMDNGERSVSSESFVVTFLCEPLMVSSWSQQIDFSWTETGEVSFLVDGTAPCPCVITIGYTTVTATTITVDTGESMTLGGTVPSYGALIPYWAKVDSENRTVMETRAGSSDPFPPDFSRGSLGVYPVESDWLYLQPGVRTLTIESSGVHYERQGRIEFSPRWV